MMKAFRFIFFFIWVLASCKTSFTPEKPAQEYLPEKREYGKKESMIAFPIEMKVSEIQAQINKYVTGVLYEDKSFTDNDNDGLVCVVKKVDDIKVEALKNFIRVTVALDVDGKYRTLGVTTGFKGVIAAQYVTGITLKDGWKVMTETKPVSHAWIKAPVIDLGLIELPVTIIADLVLKAQQNDIASEIDAAVKEYVDLKEILKPAIDALYEPMLVDETYKTWFRMEPLEIQTTQINTLNNVMKFSLGMKAYTESFLGKNPGKGDTTKFPEFKVVEKVPNDFHVGLVTVVPYQDAAEILTDQYVKIPYTYTEGKRSITLTSFDMWGQNDKMVISVGVKGSLKGIIYLTGVPFYDSTSRQIKMKNVDFHLDTKNKLLKSANWLLHGKFTKVMEKNIYFDVGTYLDETREECQVYFKNYEIQKGVFLKGKLDKIETSDMYLIKDGLVMVFDVKGKASVKVDGME